MHHDVQLQRSVSRRHFDLIAIVALASLVLFYRLGTPGVYWWDEARVAINSLEMMRHPGLIVTFHDKPELWNVKPPLLIWLNAFSMWLFGVNEWALRLPSALAALGTTVAVFLFTRRIADRRTAYLATLILLGIGGFVEVHVTRSADFDSLLVLFSTMTTFSLFLAFDRQDFKLPAATFAGGLLTKGIAGGMMMPGYIVYALICRKSPRAAIMPGLVALSLVLLLYAAREIAAPGYLAAVWNIEVMRYGVTADGTARFGYIQSLFWPWQILLSIPWPNLPGTGSAFPWSIVAFLSLFRPSQAATYLWICLGCFLLLMWAAATRHAWYIAPAFPLIAVLAALGIQKLKSRYAYWLFIVVAIECVGLNLWKAEKETHVPAHHFTYRTPDGHPYRGPDEYYEIVAGLCDRHLRIDVKRLADFRDIDCSPN